MASSVLMLLAISAALFAVVIGQPDFCNQNGEGWKAAQTFTGIIFFLSCETAHMLIRMHQMETHFKKHLQAQLVHRLNRQHRVQIQRRQLCLLVSYLINFTF